MSVPLKPGYYVNGKGSPVYIAGRTKNGLYNYSRAGNWYDDEGKFVYSSRTREHYVHETPTWRDIAMFSEEQIESAKICKAIVPDYSGKPCSCDCELAKDCKISVTDRWLLSNINEVLDESTSIQIGLHDTNIEVSNAKESS